jgi:CSLREA domain-containing protein
MKRLILVVIVAVLSLPAAASADVTVNTTADSDDGGCEAPPVGDCSLRDALDVTNSGDVITVPAGTYSSVLEWVVDHDVTIRGAGARTTTLRHFAPDSTGRVVNVLSDSTLDMSGVRVTGGNNPNGAGGGIFVSFGATLNLTASSVDGNTGDGGGGIQADGEANLVRSAVVRNHAVGGESQALGGGINIGEGGAATLENVTGSNNTAIDGDDGQGLGGGIFANNSLDLVNVTIAGNTAGQGDFGNGGGLYQNFAGGPPRTVARNALVARNVGFNCGGTVNDPIEATNGLSDELARPSCNTVGSGNQLVADTRLGTLANNGGPSDTNALLAGSPGINKGASCPTTDQRGVAREGVCDVGAYEYHAPPPPPDQGLPDPVPHKNVNALPKSGTVKVKLPGSSTFVLLDEDTQIPLGTTIDVRRGRITIVSEPGGPGADFYAGIFKLSQTKGSKPITVLTLVEKLSCAKKKQANAAAKKKRKRRLWGDGKGRFRTKGKRSAATVVGTKWLVQDTCTTTLTKVVRGKVRVRDFVKKKTVTVKAGKKYVARARP